MLTPMKGCRFREVLRQRSTHQKFGFGLWIVEKVDDAVPIGICGLLKRDSLDDIDLGFAFLAEYWGKVLL